MAPAPTPEPSCYGLRLRPGTLPLEAFDGCDSFHAPDWPLWAVDLATPASSRAAADASGWHELNLIDHHVIAVDQGSNTIRLEFSAPQPTASVLHPWLSPAFALVTELGGGLALHGGAFVIDGRAWGILGAKTAGKSSMLAELSRLGCPILSDDLIAVHQQHVFAGPRFIDLRRGAAAGHAGAVDIGHIGRRRRWRLPVGPAPASAPLAGFVVLDWGSGSPTTHTVPLPARFAHFAESRFLPERHSNEQAALLDSLARPMVAFTRERDLDRLTDSAEALVAALRETEPHSAAGLPR